MDEQNMDEHQFMTMGLSFAYNMPNRCKRETNIKRFQSHYGVKPSTCAKLWNDLLSTSNVKAQIKLDTKLILLLVGLLFLWLYPTEEQLASFLMYVRENYLTALSRMRRKIQFLFEELLTQSKQLNTRPSSSSPLMKHITLLKNLDHFQKNGLVIY